MFILSENSSSDYGPRTRFNAQQAQVTVAFAFDFKTAGERLTSSATPRGQYLSVSLNLPHEDAAAKVRDFLILKDSSYLNIAGNGLHTLSRFGMEQDDINFWLHQVLKPNKSLITRVRSGGQTGVDTAALVVALALGIDAEGHYPKGYRQRFADAVDILCTKDQISSNIEKQVSVLVSRLQTIEPPHLPISSINLSSYR